MVLAETVLRTLRRHRLIPQDSRVVVAVSGGPDSVALACVLHELQRAGGFAVAGLAHLNHTLRGEAAHADQRFCAELAGRLGVPIDVETAEVARLARERRTSIENAGRRARYEFFERAAARAAADRVAVGHTRNDQAETFLLRLLRGAGPRGLAGIRPQVGRIVRPLIDATRAEVLEYLDARRLPFRQDETNRDVSIPRNRIRHELIPLLERQFAPGVVDVLAREAAIARDDAEYLDRLAIETAARIVLLKEASRIRLDAAALGEVPPALARRVVRDALDGGDAPFVGFEHIDALLALSERGSVDLPGVRATRRGGVITVERGTPRGPRARGTARGARPEPRGPKENGFQYSLSIPGEVEVREAGWAISAQVVDADPTAARHRLSARGDSVVVRAAGLGPELTVRSRRPGDTFRPLGLGGRKKLQDFFVDRKVAREERDRVPLVVDARDRIVWVVGQTVAEDFKVTGPAEGVILLKARRLGGPG